jgi:hypothetical protein
MWATWAPGDSVGVPEVRVMQHVLRTLVIAAAFALTGMSACGPTQKPPPAGPPTGQPPAADVGSSVDASKLIYVTPVEGANSVARLVLADAIAAALRDANKPAVLADKSNEMGPTVSGRIVEVQERDTVYWVTAAWALKAPYGTPVAEYRHQIVVDKQLWQAGAPEAMNLLIADAGPMIAGMVREYVSPIAVAEPPPVAVAAQAAPPPPTATESPKPAAPAEPAPSAVEAATSTAAASVAPAPQQPAAAAAKTPSVRSKAIPRPPATAPSALTARKPEAPVETAALGAPPQAEKPKPEAEKPKAGAPGRPTVLSKGPPPRQPREKPVDDDGARRPAKPVLMPVPGETAGLVPDPPPVVWARPSFLIRPVEGAPGDGNVSLTLAMKAALRKRDLTVTDDPRQAGFVIQGRVEVGPPINGRQQAKIVWAVNTITGEEVGKAVQENAVKAGSLDGPWGRIAEIVSGAAVTGIQELFGVGDKQSSRVDLPPVPPMPELPKVPGRALPPG